MGECYEEERLETNKNSFLHGEHSESPDLLFGQVKQDTD